MHASHFTSLHFLPLCDSVSPFVNVKWGCFFLIISWEVGGLWSLIYWIVEHFVLLLRLPSRHLKVLLSFWRSCLALPSCMSLKRLYNYIPVYKHLFGFAAEFQIIPAKTLFISGRSHIGFHIVGTEYLYWIGSIWPYCGFKTSTGSLRRGCTVMGGLPQLIQNFIGA